VAEWFQRRLKTDYTLSGTRFFQELLINNKNINFISDYAMTILPSLVSVALVVSERKIKNRQYSF
jgi:hypothetical protein